MLQEGSREGKHLARLSSSRKPQGTKTQSQELHRPSDIQQVPGLQVFLIQEEFSCLRKSLSTHSCCPDFTFQAVPRHHGIFKTKKKTMAITQSNSLLILCSITLMTIQSLEDRYTPSSRKPSKGLRRSQHCTTCLYQKPVSPHSSVVACLPAEGVLSHSTQAIQRSHGNNEVQYKD